MLPRALLNIGVRMTEMATTPPKYGRNDQAAKGMLLIRKAGMCQAAQMMPMQLTPQAMQELMEQLAQDQQQVASDLGQMSNQEGQEGPLGDLEALAQEAEALAAQLASLKEWLETERFATVQTRFAEHQAYLKKLERGCDKIRDEIDILPYLRL